MEHTTHLTQGHTVHKHPRRVLTIWVLAMMNVSACMAIQNLSIMAGFGMQMIFYFALAGLLFFIPSALVSAELATGWPEAGGLYVWIREALGKKCAFLAAWLHWAQNLVWFPAQFVFIGAIAAYFINPELTHSKEYFICVILISYWGIFLLNLFGMKVSGWISSIGAVLGTILPTIVLIITAVLHIREGNHVDFDMSMSAIFPKFTSLSEISLITGMFLSIVGIELSAAHAKDVINPKRNYPRAILLSAIVILGLYTFGSLAIAVLVPNKELDLVSTVMHAFETIGGKHGIWISKTMLILIIFGAVGCVTTWMLAPAKELVVSSDSGELPPILQRLNKHEMPVSILILQGIIISLMTVSFYFLPSIEMAFWMMIAMCGQIYFLIYFMMFLSAIILRYKFPHTDRPYKIPGGKIGMWIVAGTGLTVSLFAFFLGYIQPHKDNLNLEHPFSYTLLLISGLILLILPPFVMDLYRRREWVHRYYQGEDVIEEENNP